ncbi:MAG: hypothetical protein MJ196_07075 [Treponemataceae bacterium]|nr:hypothetical protein [Treponemataceae bacterium]
MNETQWQYFCSFKTEFKKQIEIWQDFINSSPKKEFLQNLIIEAAQKDKVPAYNLENLLLYNTALDDVQKNDRIAAIAVGDNPGKDEQLNRNCKYLVGQAGKVAASFFAKNPQLQIDFRKNVIILNKTPFHSAKTKELAAITKALVADNCEESARIARLIAESQVFMAQITAKLHQNLCSAATAEEENCDLWLVGYGELKKGIFDNYKTALQNCYRTGCEKNCAAFNRIWQKVYVFQHFSMNCFASDLKKYNALHPENDLKTNLYRLGTLHKAEIFE